MDEMSQSTVFHLDDYEETLKQIEKAYSSSEEDNSDENGGDTNDLMVNGTDEHNLSGRFYCIACNKWFTSEASYKNHEMSKKHFNNIDRLINEVYGGNMDSINESKEEEIEMLEKVKKPKKLKRKSRVINAVEPEAEEVKHTSENGKGENLVTLEKRRKSAKAKRLRKYEVELQNSMTSAAPRSGFEYLYRLEREEDEFMYYSHEYRTYVNIDVPHTCVTCRFTFKSTRQLFKHLQKSNRLTNRKMDQYIYRRNRPVMYQEHVECFY